MIDRLLVCDVHGQEVIMMLNQCTKDFQSLIERLQLLRAYEDADENSRYHLALKWSCRRAVDSN